MVTLDVTLEQAETKIRQTVQGSNEAYSPIELIRHLTREGMGEDIVRVAIWYLLDRHEIELTPDWKLAAGQRL